MTKFPADIETTAKLWGGGNSLITYTWRAFLSSHRLFSSFLDSQKSFSTFTGKWSVYQYSSPAAAGIKVSVRQEALQPPGLGLEFVGEDNIIAFRAFFLGTFLLIFSLLVCLGLG